MAVSTERKVAWEAFRDHDSPDDSGWRVESDDSDTGDCQVVVFAGPDAKELALEYAAWKNSQ